MYRRNDRQYRSLYKLARWRKLRQILLSENPICKKCGIRPANEVDHIRPRDPLADDDPYDTNNLQCLCHQCHSAKTMQECRRRGGLPSEVKIHKAKVQEL